MMAKPTYQELENKIKELESYKNNQIEINLAEKEKSEKAICDSEEKYKALVENAIMGVVIHDVNGNIKYMNSRVLEIMKIENIQEAYKTPVSNFIHPNCLEVTVIGIKNAYEKNIPFHKEQKFIRVDGKHIDVIVFAKQTVFNNEKVIQVTFNDISKRKQAERDLKKQIEEYASLNEEYKAVNDELRNTNKKIVESEEYFKALIENSTDAISVIDEKGKSIYRSASYEKIMGFEVGEMLGKNIFEFIYADDRAILMQQLASSLKSPLEIKQISFRSYHKDGTLRYLEGTGKNMLGSPYVKGIVINYRDVTIRKQAEKKMQELNEELAVQNEEYLTLNEELNESVIRIQNTNAELEEAKKQIEENETHLRTLFNAMVDVVFEIDDEGTYIYIAPTSPELMFKPSSLTIGKTLHDVFAKAEADVFLEFIRKSLCEDKINIIEYPLNIEGKTVWFEGRAIPKTKNTVLYIARNITEQKLATQALKESNAYNKVLFNNSSIPLIVMDLHTNKYTDCNKAAVDIYGYKNKEEVLGKTPLDVSYPTQYNGEDSLKLALEKINEAKEKDSVLFEWKHKRPNGEIWDGEVHLMTIEHKDKKLLLFSLLDITERKKNERKIKKQTEEYLSLIEELKSSEEEVRAANEELISTSDALKESNNELIKAKEDAVEIGERYLQLFDMLPYGGEILNSEGIIVNCSQSSARMLGYSVEEIIGKHITNFVNAETIDVFKKNFAEIKEGQPFLTEAVMIHKDGSSINVLRSAQPVFDANKKFLNIIALNVNITERIITEKKLVIAKEKAEESDRLKTEFINNMSHEIRTPMNGILGFSEFLGMPDLTETKRNQYITIIKNSGNQLMRIIDDILEISQLGTKQVKVSENKICLNDLLLEQFSIFDIKAKENKIPLYLKKGLKDKESIILVDEVKLNKILSNLLENALKFTNEGFVEFGYNIIKSENAVFLEIYVKDTGIGIKIESQKIIFDRFSQEEKELSKNVGGLGLGLSIAKENAKLLGGFISLESKKGEGATFFITIPYKPISAEGKQIELSLISENKLPMINNDSFTNVNTILIVEDEEINHLYIDTLLENFGYELTTIHARNGKEAVEICKENSEINLVLMDLKMPIMNGFEATKLIKEFRPNLSIIAQTAYSTKEEKERASIAGCNDFISKPISEGALNGIVVKYLELN